MVKPNLTDNERKAVIDELLKLSYNGKLPRGAYAKVGSNMGRDPTTVSSIWKRYASAVAAGVVGGEWTSRIKQNSGRKRKSRDEVRVKLVSAPVEARAVERRVAVASGLSRHLIRYAVKEGIVRRQTTFIEPALTRENKMQRVEHALSFIDDATVCREVCKDYLLTKVFPAIKAQWPRKDRRQIIFVQQDNAKPHVAPSDPDVVEAGTKEGWNIRLLCQAPNSPDLNCLDLGVFASMQSIQYRLPRKGIDALIASVEDFFRKLKTDTVDDIFLTLQACMLAVLQEEGGNLYKIPHLGKAKLRRAKQLPVSLTCSKELYDSAIALLKSANHSSALLFNSTLT
ncbi:hypothetical protein PC128_g633 [Phytophthora cactorum]|nr:hypothetical protein PC120_g5250 [Phytophthora cactorum]KAG3083116.1 hypothetical protein PC121_g5821 [Phytophthora cactorum]KAG3206649.1 hypothetical protein PC128_g633 [Phytophthora cactorum]KAG4060983.1 hypothetical protein PC123_g4130 [Phytophthora cactorum]